MNATMNAILPSSLTAEQRERCLAMATAVEAMHLDWDIAEDLRDAGVDAETLQRLSFALAESFAQIQRAQQLLEVRSTFSADITSLKSLEWDLHWHGSHTASSTGDPVAAAEYLTDIEGTPNYPIRGPIFLARYLAAGGTWEALQAALPAVNSGLMQQLKQICALDAKAQAYGAAAAAADAAR